MRRLCRSFIGALLMGSALTASSLAGQATAHATPATAPVAPPAAVAAFRTLLSNRYVIPLDTAALKQASSLDQLLALVATDPFTDVYSPEGWRQFTVGSGQAFGGIGAVIGAIRDTLVVERILEDGPAARAGLHPRDRVISIDDSATTGWPLPRAVGHLRGALGTPVRVGLLREGVPARTVKVVRASVQVPSITSASVTAHGLGVVTISQFGPDLSSDLAEVIRRLSARGMRGLILDLRGNPGGLLNEAIATANLFLPRGSLVVETRYRGEDPERHIADQPTDFADLPLAVLVGPQTASAAEILAGALQDTHRAIVVGQQTYGKGLVQSTGPLAEGWMVKMTVGRWYTPAGRLIDRGRHASADSTKPFDPMAPHSGGIVPDVVSADSVDAAGRAAYELMGHSGRAIAIALDDEVGAFLRTHPDFPPSQPPVAGSAAHLWERMGAAADSIPPSARTALAPWLDAEVTRRAVAARYGSWAEGIWQYSRDPEIDAAATALAERLAAR